MADVKRTDEIQGEILHEYDGIEEADNELPNWWLLTFYGAIVFGIGYWFYYHEYQMGPTTPEVFASEMATRASAGDASEEALLALAADPSTVAQGREAYTTTCAACHGAEAQGEIGPNLTDDHWLHGGAPTAIYATVREGVTPAQALIAGSAGMPAWGAQLGETRTRAVVAYLLSIRDTNVEGREPEGEVYDPSAPAEGAEGATDEEATDEEATDEEATDEEATDEEATDEEATDEEATDEEATDEEATEAPEEGAATEVEGG